MASTYTELCTKLEEHYTVLDMVATERETTSDALSTHVRYYIPLTVEEYTFMVDKEQAPLVSTIQAASRMPLYNRINGLLERSHAYMFMAYMYTGSNLYTESKEAFYIVEAYVSQSALHAHVEDSTMCLFSRDHMSPTLAFDYNYSFSQQEKDLQRIYRVTLHGGATLTTPLEVYSFSKGYAWDFWVVVSFEELLQSLEDTTGPPTWALRFLYNWSCYVGHLIYDIEIDPTVKTKLLKLMHTNGITTPLGSNRTMDHLLGASEALDNYKSIPTDDLKKSVMEWRADATKATTPGGSTEQETASVAATPGTGPTEERPTKKRAMW